MFSRSLILKVWPPHKYIIFVTNVSDKFKVAEIPILPFSNHRKTSLRPSELCQKYLFYHCQMQPSDLVFMLLMDSFLMLLTVCWQPLTVSYNLQAFPSSPVDFLCSHFYRLTTNFSEMSRGLSEPNLDWYIALLNGDVLKVKLFL